MPRHVDQLDGLLQIQLLLSFISTSRWCVGSNADGYVSRIRSIGLSAFSPIRVLKHIESGVSDDTCIGVVRNLGANEVLV